MTPHVGTDIRALRKARGQTLQDLATAVGRSTGWLSQVERGQTMPAIPDLAKLAGIFGVTISFFFRSAARNPQEQGLILRKADRVSLGNAESGLTEELLSPSLGGAFEMIQSTFAPGARGGNPAPRADRQDGGVLISGQLTLRIGDLETTLHPGDSFQFSCQPYSWANETDAPAVALWVISPPIY